MIILKQSINSQIAVIILFSRIACDDKNNSRPGHALPSQVPVNSSMIPPFHVGFKIKPHEIF